MRSIRILLTSAGRPLPEDGCISRANPARATITASPRSAGVRSRKRSAQHLARRAEAGRGKFPAHGRDDRGKQMAATPEQLEELKESFEYNDANGDGRIELSEFLSM